MTSSDEMSHRRTIIPPLYYSIGLSASTIGALLGLSAAQVRHTARKFPSAATRPTSDEARLLAALRYLGVRGNHWQVKNVLKQWKPIEDTRTMLAGMVYSRWQSLFGWTMELPKPYLRLFVEVFGQQSYIPQTEYRSEEETRHWGSLLESVAGGKITTIDTLEREAYLCVNGCLFRHPVLNKDATTRVQEFLDETLHEFSQPMQSVFQLYYGIAGTSNPDGQRHTLKEVQEKLQLTASKVAKLRHCGWRTIWEKWRVQNRVLVTATSLQMEATRLEKELAAVPPPEAPVAQSAEELSDEQEAQRFKNLMTPLDTFEWSVRTMNVFQNAELTYVWQLAVLTEKDLYRKKNCGRKSAKEIREILLDLGLTLGSAFDEELRTRLEEASQLSS